VVATCFTTQTNNYEQLSDIAGPSLWVLGGLVRSLHRLQAIMDSCHSDSAPSGTWCGPRLEQGSGMGRHSNRWGGTRSYSVQHDSSIVCQTKRTAANPRFVAPSSAPRVEMKQPTAVSDHAVQGQSAASFLSAGRLNAHTMPLSPDTPTHGPPTSSAVLVHPRCASRASFSRRPATTTSQRRDLRALCHAFSGLKSRRRQASGFPSWQTA
jgi:hypothetical protein